MPAHYMIESGVVLNGKSMGFVNKVAEVLALEKAARDSGARVVIDEGSPPHLHVQF